MYITVEAVMKSLDKMRKIYPFKDDDTVFRMDRNYNQGMDSVVCIATLDKETGVKVRLEKDAREEMQEGE